MISTHYSLLHGWHERIPRGQCETKQFLSVLNRSTSKSSKFETTDALKQKTENASEEFSLAYQFPNIKVFFGLVLNSSLVFHVKTNQNTEQT